MAENVSRKDVMKLVKDALNEHAVEGRKVLPSTVERVIDCLFDKVLPGQLAQGNSIAINDFGKLAYKTRDARKGRNPQTGEEIQIEEKATVTFKPASKLKELLN